MFFNRQWIDKAKSIKLSNEIITLKPIRFFSDRYNGSIIKNYTYQIFNHNETLVGYCDLRVGDESALFYLGNIGYNIFSHHQRKGYATQATYLLLDLARQLDLEKINITCNTDNIASIRTIEKTGFKYVESVVVPADEPLFQQWDYFKHIYTLDLKKREKQVSIN